MKAGHTRPINKTAAMVVSKGVLYESKAIKNEVESDVPLPTRLPMPNELAQSVFVDLAGFRRGRFTVIGQCAVKSGLWVVRCDCGVYARRKSKSIRNANNNQDRCSSCRNLAQIRRCYDRNKTGKDCDINNYD